MLRTWDHDGWKENEKPVKITTSVIFLSRIGGSGGRGGEFPIVKEFPEGSAVSHESSESEDAGADLVC